jgi:hypothetical protein
MGQALSRLWIFRKEAVENKFRSQCVYWTARIHRWSRSQWPLLGHTFFAS